MQERRRIYRARLELVKAGYAPGRQNTLPRSGRMTVEHEVN